LAQRLDCLLSQSSLSRLIHRIGFVWRRPKLTLRSDPQASERQEAIEAATAAHPGAPRLFGDESDLHLLPILRAQYQKPGQQTSVPTPGANRKQPIFGFLEVLSGQWHYWLTKTKRSVDLLACLQELYQLYPTGPILLFLDNASIHKSKLTLRWLSHHPRFLVYYLPAYSGHSSNPVEKIWWALKAECSANCLYPCLDALEDAIHGFFAFLTPPMALQLIGRQQMGPPKSAEACLTRTEQALFQTIEPHELRTALARAA
jgi:hypothetical protein